MTDLKLNFPKLHSSSEIASPHPSKHSSLEGGLGPIELNFKLSYIGLTTSNGRRKQLSRSWICRLPATFKDNTEFSIKVDALKPLRSKNS